MRGRWQPGDEAVLREVLHGRTWSAAPCRVVEDGPGYFAGYIAPGTPWKLARTRNHKPTRPRHRLPEGAWTLSSYDWRMGQTVMILEPGTWHAVFIFWKPHVPHLYRWLIKSIEPVRRMPWGFEYTDQLHYLRGSADRSEWTSRPERDLAEAVKLDILKPERLWEYKRELEQVRQRIVQRRPPFDSRWDNWAPNPDWGVPPLREAWAT